MSGRRLEKLNQFIREEVSRIIDRELEFPEEMFATVTRVDTSPDKHYADVFVSLLGSEPKKILEILEENVYNIQQKLNRRLRIRPVPKITFLIDEEEMRREVVEKSLGELKRKGEI